MVEHIRDHLYPDFSCILWAFLNELNEKGQRLCGEMKDIL